MSEQAEFLAQVEKYLEETGSSPSRFGREFAADPLFVFNLRKGREPRSDTRNRILAQMRETERQDMKDDAPLRLGIAGVGTVGASLISMFLNEQERMMQRFGRQITVTGISARSRSKDRGVDLSNMTWFDDPVALAKSDDIDLFVELMGGEDGPALARSELHLNWANPS